MADALTVAGKTATVVAGGALTGAPPEFLFTAVLAGAALSAYSQHGAQFQLRPGWLAGVLGHVAVAAGFGYTASTAFVQLAPQYEMLRPLLAIEHWVWGVAFSGTSHWSLPLLKQLGTNLLADRAAKLSPAAPAVPAAVVVTAAGKKAEDVE